MEYNVSIYDALDEAKKQYLSYQQADDESNEHHLINFKKLTAGLTHYGGDLFMNEHMVKYEKNSDKK